MKYQSLKSVVALLLLYGAYWAIFGYIESVRYSFKILTDFSGPSVTNYSALWRALPFAVVATILGYLLRSGRKWVFWATLLYASLVFLGALMAIITQAEVAYIISGIGMPVMWGLHLLFTGTILAGLLGKGARSEIFGAS